MLNALPFLELRTVLSLPIRYQQKEALQDSVGADGHFRPEGSRCFSCNGKRRRVRQNLLRTRRVMFPNSKSQAGGMPICLIKRGLAPAWDLNEFVWQLGFSQPEDASAAPIFALLRIYARFQA